MDSNVLVVIDANVGIIAICDSFERAKNISRDVADLWYGGDEKSMFIEERHMNRIDY